MSAGRSEGPEVGVGSQGRRGIIGAQGGGGGRGGGGSSLDLRAHYYVPPFGWDLGDGQQWVRVGWGKGLRGRGWGLG